MKIIIIHYRYFHESGPETYLFNVKKALEANGHSVVPFSINYENNVKNDYDNYFIDPIGSKKEFHIHKQKLNFIDKIKIFSNFFWNRQAYYNLDKLIKEIKPDIIYILQFLGKLSPSILFAARKNRIPVALRVSDFGLICGKNIFFNNNKEICTKCISKPSSIILNNCKSNLMFSFLSYLSLKFMYFIGAVKLIDLLIAPSKNTISLLLQKKEINSISKVEYIPTFYDNYSLKNDTEGKKDIISYWGRIEEDKGLEFIINCLLNNDLNIIFNIYGKKTLYQDYLNSIISYSSNTNKIKFYNNMDRAELFNHVIESKYSIFASKWFDNLPNSLIESLYLGIPAIAPNFGCFSEFIFEGENGFLYEKEDSQDFLNTLKKALSFKDYEQLSAKSQKYAHDIFSKDKHIDKLINSFYELTKIY